MPKEKSIRHGSFFSRSKLHLGVCLCLLKCWAADIPVTHVRSEIGSSVSVKCALDYYNFCRDVCSADLLDNPICLGGQGVIVQIDESSFAHDKKVGTLADSEYLLL